MIRRLPDFIRLLLPIQYESEVQAQKLCHGTDEGGERGDSDASEDGDVAACELKVEAACRSNDHAVAPADSRAELCIINTNSNRCHDAVCQVTAVSCSRFKDMLDCNASWTAQKSDIIPAITFVPKVPLSIVVGWADPPLLSDIRAAINLWAAVDSEPWCR